MRIKQFEDKIEESPDFITLRNHVAKTVTGDGKKVMLMNSLWRLLKEAYHLSSGTSLVAETEATKEPAEGETVTTELPSL